MYPAKTYLIATAAVLALFGCARGPVNDRAEALTPKQLALLDKNLKGKVAGEPRNCISTLLADQSVRVSDRILLYRISGNLVYRTDLSPGCEGIDRDDTIMVVRQNGTQLCDGELLRLVDRTGGFFRGACSFGRFVPYRAPGAN